MGKVSEQFSELIAALEKCKKFCPWLKEQTIESYAPQIAAEADEVLEAVKKKDYENLKEELGDVLWDVLMIAHLAQDEGLFEVDDVLRSVVEKMKRRKPYVFEGKHVTIEEAWRVWKEVKAKEKERRE